MYPSPALCYYEIVTKPIRPIVLIIMDGVGIAPASDGNAVTKATTPFLEQIWDTYPHTYLQASEEYVGLPKGIKGNSEIGHMNLGSGRVVYQDLPRINKAIETGSFYSNQAFVAAVNHVRTNKSKLHLAVCFSDSGTHGTIDHLEEMLKLLAQKDFELPVIIHAFTDGRDAPPQSAKEFFTRVEAVVQSTKQGTFGTVTGRYYAMDRNQVWDRVQLAYDLLTTGTGYKAKNWTDAIDQAYKRGETDEFIKPTLIENQLTTPVTVDDNDAFILLNFRSDRAIELTSAFVLPEFNQFTRSKTPQNLFYVGMNEYAKGIPQNIAFPKEDIALPLGRIISENNLRQLRIAESEKFPHVTYFFNGGRSIKFEGEDRVEISSPDVATYDLQPEMSLPKVTQVLIEKISLRIYDLIVFNIANGDMVGHTGVWDAAVKAMAAVEESVKKIVKAANSVGGAAIITADHGNIEEMLNTETHEIDTEHSLNPVPFILMPPERITNKNMLQSGILADVTPTILELMGLTRPDQVTGKNLLR